MIWPVTTKVVFGTKRRGFIRKSLLSKGDELVPGRLSTFRLWGVTFPGGFFGLIRRQDLPDQPEEIVLPLLDRP